MTEWLGRRPQDSLAQGTVEVLRAQGRHAQRGAWELPLSSRWAQQAHLDAQTLSANTLWIEAIESLIRVSCHRLTHRLACLPALPCPLGNLMVCPVFIAVD